MGGSFGQKTSMWREDLALCVASKRLGRPVRWVEDRIENMTSATHARDERVDVDAAVTDDGTILALDVRMTLDQGAYPLPTTFSPLFGWVARHMIPSSYRLQNMRWAFTVVATNKASYGAYRGPWAVETLLRELIVDQVARELGLDPVDVRRRNLITAGEQPTTMITGPTLEDVTSLETLERAVELLDYEAFREEQRLAREQGRLLGIGFSTYIEAAPGPPDFFDGLGFKVGGERANAILEPDGRLTVFTTQQGPGVGHETTLAQVAATELGVPLDHVRIVHGDTNLVPFSMIGTGGSRAATMASGAALMATRTVKRKALEVAADLLEIAPGDLEIVDAMVTPRGDPGKAIPLADVAAAAYFAPPSGEEPGLRSSEVFGGQHARRLVGRDSRSHRRGRRRDGAGGDPALRRGGGLRPVHQPRDRRRPDPRRRRAGDRARPLRGRRVRRGRQLPRGDVHGLPRADGDRDSRRSRSSTSTTSRSRKWRTRASARAAPSARRPLCSTPSSTRSAAGRSRGSR